jgi:hypothetical protein
MPLPRNKAAGNPNYSSQQMLGQRGAGEIGPSAMRNRIEIDPEHCRAIGEEIAERLRPVIAQEPEVPPNLETRIDRLRALESSSPSIVPDMDRDG